MIVFALIFIGILMIYSASGIYALEELGDSLYYLKRHVVFVLVGIMAALAVMAVDYRDLQRWAKPLLLFNVLLLVLVLLPGLGRSGGGAQRWFHIGPLYFQPTELMKITMIIYTADFLSRKQNRVMHIRDVFAPAMIVLGVVSGLIIKQPDLGSVVLIGLVVLIMLFVAGVRWQHFSLLAALFLPMFYFFVYRVPYRWLRIVTFVDPWKDPTGAGFQLTQSQIAFGSGGLVGVGLGQSVQKLFYLPAAHTDFILSIIGEEFGFIGAFFVILLFIMLIWQGARIAKRTQDPFGYFLSLGIVAMLGIQAVVNIGVTIGALPTKGLPLPFISYGGSALVTNMMMVGLLLNVSRISDIEV